MSQELTPTELFDQLAEFYAANEPAGFEVRWGNDNKPINRFRPVRNWEVHSRWEFGWGIEANLCVDVPAGKVDIGWSTTGYTPAQAIAASTLHRKVAEFGCLLECFLEQFDVSDLKEQSPEWEEDEASPTNRAGDGSKVEPSRAE